MNEIESVADAWIVPPSDYLVRRPETHRAPASPLSLYVTMQDGCRLAVDTYLPTAEAQGGWPTVVIFTPYYRRYLVASGEFEIGYFQSQRDLFVTRGYALVIVDVRGTGASFGRRIAFRSPVERGDYHEIADWIVAQPWSNGVIGATGASYQGAAACFLASTGHQAVRAIAPVSSVSDIYSEQLYPGGMLSRVWSREYADLINALDHIDREEIARFPMLAERGMEGPAPVDDDPDGALLAMALAEHRDNANLHDVMTEWNWRGEGLSSAPWLTTDVCSPFHYLKRGMRPGLPVYSISGWFDGGGYANGAISRFLTLAGQHDRLLLGCWDHCGGINASPYRRHQRPQIDVDAEILRFFDEHLLGLDTGAAAEAPVHYFSAHAETWRAAENWPVGAPRILLFEHGGRLQMQSTKPETTVDYQTRFTTGTGRKTRWERLGAVNIEDFYSDWNGREDACLTFSTDPFDAPIEITGHIIARLRVAASEPDAALFVYASEIEADGTSRYMTEGMVRLLHRTTATCPDDYRTSWTYRTHTRCDAALLTPHDYVEVEIAFLPVSWTLMPGSRLRIAIAGADVDHFPTVPPGRPPLLRFALGGSKGCRVEIPEVRAG